MLIPWQLITIFNFEDLLQFFYLFILRLRRLCLLLLSEIAAERFNAIYWPLNHQTISMRAVMACYFDGVEVNFSSHVSSATPHQQPTGSECLHLFIRFVSSCDYLLPQLQHLEKVSAKNCSSLFESVFL